MTGCTLFGRGTSAGPRARGSRDAPAAAAVASKKAATSNERTERATPARADVSSPALAGMPPHEERPVRVASLCSPAFCRAAARRAPGRGRPTGSRASPSRPALPADARATLDRLVNDAIRAGGLPGGVLVVTSSQRVLYRNAYGVRTLEPRPLANDPSTIYELASMTKPLATATAVMLLAQRGVLRLNDRVSRWIPEFAQNGKHDVTLLQLLTHTGGMQIDYVRADYQADVPTILAHTYAAPLRFAPGTKFEYSDLAFITLADVVSARGRHAVRALRAGADLPPARHARRVLRHHDRPGARRAARAADARPERAEAARRLRHRARGSTATPGCWRPPTTPRCSPAPTCAPRAARRRPASR